jgi:hypothetical protein
MMRDPIEVLRVKEMEVVRVQKEIDALKIAARLLADDGHSNGEQRDERKQVVEMP